LGERIVHKKKGGANKMIRIKIACFNHKDELVSEQTVEFWSDFEQVLAEVYERMASWNIKRISIEKVALRR